MQNQGQTFRKHIRTFHYFSASNDYFSTRRAALDDKDQQPCYFSLLYLFINKVKGIFDINIESFVSICLALLYHP